MFSPFFCFCISYASLAFHFYESILSIKLIYYMTALFPLFIDERESFIPCFLFPVS